jgi:Tol biopolymer transport system component
MRTDRVRLASLAFVAMLVAVACDGEGQSGATGETPPTLGAGETGAQTPETDPGPFLLDLATGEETPLPEDLSEGAVYVASPDGTRIAYSTYFVLYGTANDVMTIANTDGTGARAISVPDGLNGYVSEWSPDSTRLLYQGRYGGGDDVGNLFLYDVAAERSTQLTDLPLPVAAWYEIHTDFSPDGREVLFHLPRTDSFESPKFDVWSVPVSGGEPKIVVRDAAFPMYVSGGKEIAFVVPGPQGFYGPRIAILSADGSRRTLLVADNDLYLPRESPDGTRIAYADGGSIYLVDVSTGETTVVADGEQAEWVDDGTIIVKP